MRYPYFKFAQAPTVSELKGWAEHFRDRGIACAIVENARTGPGSRESYTPAFSLWRMGDEFMTSAVKEPNAEKLQGVIIETWLGFNKSMRREEW